MQQNLILSVHWILAGLTCLGGFEVEPTNWPDTASTANMPDKGGPVLNGQRPEVEDKGEEPGRWYLHELIHYDDFSSKVHIWLGGLHCNGKPVGDVSGGGMDQSIAEKMRKGHCIAMDIGY